MPSRPYTAASPPPSTVTFVHVCGFVHWKSFTVPVISTVFVKSNTAVE